MTIPSIQNGMRLFVCLQTRNRCRQKNKIKFIVVNLEGKKYIEDRLLFLEIGRMLLEDSSRYFFEVLAHFTTDQTEKEKFIEFTTAEGQQARHLDNLINHLQTLLATLELYLIRITLVQLQYYDRRVHVRLASHIMEFLTLIPYCHKVSKTLVWLSL